MTRKSSQDDFVLEKALITPNSLFRAKKDIIYWLIADSQMDTICFTWYSQSDPREILEPPWSVLDMEPYGSKTLDIAPK